MKGRIWFVGATVLSIFLLWVGLRGSYLPDTRSHLSPGRTRFPRRVDVSDSIRTNLADYLWPTDAGRIITSTFGEFRSTHFHGGIDISTGDRTGYRVFASRDGYVSRIRISPVGYGKMLYVRHADGYTTTYAHLSRFADAINSRAAAEQQRLDRYPVDFTCAPSEFRVRKGDLIAYTGETGVGSPHLHFEIRDENFNPVNPLLCREFESPDGIPPVIRRIAVTPIGEHSLLDGGWDTRVYTPRPSGHNVSVIPQTIRITGDAGIAVQARDKTEGTRFRRGVYSHQLFLDEKPLYTVKLDRVPGRESQQIGLYYDWLLRDEGEGRFEKLYMDTPNALPFYLPRSLMAGVIHSGALPEGMHTFRIVSQDFEGNTSRLEGTLVVNHPPSFTMVPSGSDLLLTFPDISRIGKILIASKRNAGEIWSTRAMIPDSGSGQRIIRLPLPPGPADVVRISAENTFGTPSPPGFYFIHKPRTIIHSLTLTHVIEQGFVRILLQTTGSFTAPPQLTVEEGTANASVNMTPVDLRTFAGTFQPVETFSGLRRVTANAEEDGIWQTAKDEFELYPIVPGRSGTLRLAGGNIVIAYDSLSVYSTLFLQLATTVTDEGTVYSLMPDHIMLRDGIDVTLRASMNPNEGLYFRRHGSWSLLTPGKSAVGQTLTGRITRTLGSVTILRDDLAPSIYRTSITHIGSRKPLVSCRFRDNLSGVDYDELKEYIDGMPVIPEIDGEHRRALYQFNDPLVPGSHRFTIRLKDNQGNTSEIERRFVVR